MLRSRRTLAAALVLGAGALTLTGCIAPPPSIPASPSATAVTSAPVPQPTPSQSPSQEAPETQAAPSGSLPFTVDDGLGDTWSFDLVEVVADPPLSSGAPEQGTFAVGVVIDAEHVEGNVGFTGCFDILVEGTDGEIYDYADTFASLTPENDIYFVEDERSFAGAVAAVQLPEGVEPVSVILRSSYGYPDVADTVFEIQ